MEIKLTSSLVVSLGKTLDGSCTFEWLDS